MRACVAMIAIAFITLVIPGPAAAATPSLPPASGEVRTQLAPSGKLRMAITNADYFVTRDATTGELRGIAVDLGRAIASSLNVPFEPLVYQDFNRLVEGASTGTWDLALMGYDSSRESIVAFSAPVMEIDVALLVGPHSRIVAMEDVDRVGHRIAVPRNTISDLVLGRTLKAAELVRAPGMEAAFAEVASGRADGYSALRPTLTKKAAQLPGSRVLDGRFDAARPSLAVPRGRDAAAAYVRAAVEVLKANGLVASSIQRSGAAVRPAP